MATLLRPATRNGGAGPTAPSVSRREGWARRLPLLPAFIYIFLVTQIPFVLTVYYSFFEWNLLKPGSFKFAWLENYAALITNSSIRVAIWNTVLLTLCVIGISVVLGLAVAMLLNSDVFGKGFMRTLMIAPFLIMPTAGALVWKDTLLNPLFGLLPYLLTPFGLSRVDWVNQFPMVTVVAVEVWRWTPFMMLIILAGLQSQNPEVLEAARVDGASAFQAFRRITLPLARPFIELGALLGSLFVVQTYDSIFMLTYGGPGEDTTNIPFLLYLVAFQGYNIGQASAIGVVAVIMTTIVATFALRTLFSIFQIEARR
ncbi:MAG: sugar ABC transporter permease [Chloroflexi bacterium]|nr:MAG: sugar ABC transporter permease [Chloroflexota bacterium]TMF98154.1 MAG: sugar ABC transporter permease [Chloroflexota bacterium]